MVSDAMRLNWDPKTRGHLAVSRSHVQSVCALQSYLSRTCKTENNMSQTPSRTVVATGISLYHDFRILTLHKGVILVCFFVLCLFFSQQWGKKTKKIHETDTS